jgi:HEAT repeat protein
MQPSCQVERWISLLAQSKSAGVAISMLSDLGEAALPTLLQALKSPANREMYENLAEVLVRLGPIAVEPLIRELTGDETSCLSLAAQVLGQIGDNRAIPALVAILGHELWTVRYSAITALRNLGAVDAVQDIEKLVKDRNSLIRYSAIRALGELGKGSSRAALEHALKSRRPDIRGAAVEAIQQIDSRVRLSEESN